MRATDDLQMLSSSLMSQICKTEDQITLLDTQYTRQQILKESPLLSNAALFNRKYSKTVEYYNVNQQFSM